MRWTGVAAIATWMLVAAGAALPGAASAAGCPSQQSVLPYSKNSPPYQCAQMRNSGLKSIGAWATHSWTNSTPLGYEVKSHCYYHSDKDVTVIEAWVPASYTATATNWDTGTRHWAAGVLWTTGSVDDGGYSNGCDNQGTISNSIQKITSLSVSPSATSVTLGTPITFTATLSQSSAPGGVALRMNGQPVAQAPLSGGVAKLTFTPPSAGTFTFDVAYGGDTSACPQRTDGCGYTGVTSSAVTVSVTDPVAATTPTTPPTPAGSSETPDSSTPPSAPAAFARMAQASADPALATRTRTATLPANLAQRCPSGSVLMHADTLVSGSTAPTVKVAEGLRGARVIATPATNGKRVALQVTCRKAGLPRLVGRTLGYGTEHADRMATTRRGGTLFGGPGADRLRVAHNAGVVYGGLGDDRITVAGTDGVADGGSGDDRLVASGNGRALLIGGPGHDTFVAGRGATFINAADGERDEIVCASRRNRVVADRHDVVTGPCRPVRR